MFAQRRRRRAAAISTILTAAALLAACTADEHPRPPDSGSSPTTTLAVSDAERVASDAYHRFIELSDLVLSEGGSNPDRMAEGADGDALEQFVANAREFESQSIRITGHTKFDSLKVQDREPTAITFYVCEDVSDTDLVNSLGESVVQPDRATRSPWLVSATGNETAGFMVSSRDLWSGKNFC
jgi:hypothetical protein